MKRTLAIGDIHGCHRALQTLLDAVRPTPEDCLVFLGDYINRGPDTRRVLETLLGLKETRSPVFLRGNHEVMILEARDDATKTAYWLSHGGSEALASYGAENRDDWAACLPASHWAFLESTQRYFETDSHLFVHGCLNPDWDMEQQPDRLLFWEKFDQMRPHKSGKRVICGHTRQRSGLIQDLGFAICIDTGPAGGGWLSCLDVDSGRVVQSNQQGEIRRDPK